MRNTRHHPAHRFKLDRPCQLPLRQLFLGDIPKCDTIAAVGQHCSSKRNFRPIRKAQRIGGVMVTRFDGLKIAIGRGAPCGARTKGLAENFMQGRPDPQNAAIQQLQLLKRRVPGQEDHVSVKQNQANIYRVKNSHRSDWFLRLRLNLSHNDPWLSQAYLSSISQKTKP